ncbi:hypothetical protein O9929_19755 [Vibrio lentus]|nr:hypothetical protein [Vibrio lentus]
MDQEDEKAFPDLIPCSELVVWPLNLKFNLLAAVVVRIRRMMSRKTAQQRLT